MRRSKFTPCLLSLLAACAAPAPQGDQAASGQPATQTVRNYDDEAITGSHLKRRGGVSAMDGQTLSRDALDEWQRQRTGIRPPGAAP